MYDDDDELLNGKAYSDDSIYTDNDCISENSISTNINYDKRLLNNKICVEKGFHKFIKEVDGKLLKIGFYETNITPGSLIRSATTGNRYENFLVGSYIEDLFFKVCNTTIETGKRAPLFIFFDSPEQFEKHFRCTISDVIKEKWRIKNIIAINRREEILKKELFSN